MSTDFKLGHYLNKSWLEDEIADVVANIDLVIQRFKLNDLDILKRSRHKKTLLKQWHDKAQKV